MLKIAVVGTGIIGINHLRAISKSKNCKLCAICDINKEAVASLAEEYHVPYFIDYKDIVHETDAEAVILNLPHWLHCEATQFFLDSGLHVLVEKPMANTVEECDCMIAAAERNNKKLAIGHVQRYFEANRKVKEIYESGELGELCMFTERRTTNYFAPNRPAWFLDKRLSGGGIVMNYGAHALDKLFYVMESEPTEIHAITGNIKNDSSIEGHAQIFIKFKNNVSANITFCGYGNSGYESIYYFTEGALKVTNTTELWKNTGKGWNKVDMENDEEHLLRQLEEFCKLVKGEPSTIPTGEYSRQIIKTIEQIYQQ